MSETSQIEVKVVDVAGTKMIGFFSKDPVEVMTIERTKEFVRDIEYELAMAEDS